MRAESEFGRGLATCLFMFLNHEARLRETVDLYLDMGKRHPSDGLFSESSAVEIWANGATDHLYEMLAPARLPKRVRTAAIAVRETGLDMGHGFRSRFTLAEANDLLAAARSVLDEIGSPTTLDEAMDIDRKLGLRPEAGQWSCPRNITRKGTKP